MPERQAREHRRQQQRRDVRRAQDGGVAGASGHGRRTLPPRASGDRGAIPRRRVRTRKRTRAVRSRYDVDPRVRFSPPEGRMSPHRDRPHPTRSLLILSLGALAFALAQTMLIPALGELTRPARHGRERDRVGAHRLPARRRGRDADRRPARRHVRQAPPARRLPGVFAARLRRRRARRHARAWSSPAACCRASAAASSRSLLDHPRRVPAREGRRVDRADLRHLRHRRRRSAWSAAA